MEDSWNAVSAARCYGNFRLSSWIQTPLELLNDVLSDQVEITFQVPWGRFEAGHGHSNIKLGLT